MANPSKARGTAFETDVVNYLRANGFPAAHRKVLSGRLDTGDISPGPLLPILECKAVKAIDLAGFMDEATVEAQHADVPFGAAVIKRRGKNVAKAYVVHELCDYVDLLAGYEANEKREQAANDRRF